ncbi:nucleotidyltransferase domain-containing protein [Fictibacillus solisalsi]|uniref:nucleotidyltransferase domain-containing protein n=1 Tax=Fictibacillus solisalsi TaxID=459525 RepID=UPI000B19B5DE|nr:nucleotidyltransferase domain-containing protein [Fictibacillus solisalsi]
MQSLTNRARQMAEVYQKNKKIAGVLLAGSVSRGWDDSHSDIELHIFWKKPPEDRERHQPIEEVNGEIIDFHPYEEEEWAETYLVNGVKFEISSFLVSTIQEVLQQVVRQANTNYDFQCLAASFKDGKILFEEEGTLSALKEEVTAYPAALSENMIIENLELGSRWNNRNALLSRKDWLMYMIYWPQFKNECSAFCLV